MGGGGIHVIAPLWRSENTCRSQCSPFTMWVPGIQLRSSGLSAESLPAQSRELYHSFIYLLTYFYLYKVALSSSDYPGTCDIDQSSLILTKIFLSLCFRAGFKGAITPSWLLNLKNQSSQAECSSSFTFKARVQLSFVIE